MIVTENVTMYKCEHCPKRYYRKQDILKHEFNCSRNPKNFSACHSCVHLEETEVEYVYYTEEESIIKKTTGFHCNKLNKDMYPFKAAKKGLPIKYPKTFKDQIQMPSACDFKEEKSLEEYLNNL